jgi:hypothetical protein
MSKTINDIQVSDEVFNKMVLLQERARRIDAEAKILQIEKIETEKAVTELMASIEKSEEKKDAPPTMPAEQVKAVANA